MIARLRRILLAEDNHIATVFVFYAALFLLTSSGRLASTDAGAELQAAMLLVTTGHLISPVRPALAPAGWVEGTRGRFHEPHDIGPVLLLAPAAWLGHLVSGRSAAEDFNAPPVESRLGASLTCAVWSALGCCLLFMAFAVDADTRTAFVLSLVLPATTMFWPYARTAWDVGAGAVAMCAFLYTVRRAVRDEAAARDVYLVMAAVVLTASFRSIAAAPFSSSRWEHSPCRGRCDSVVRSGQSPLVSSWPDSGRR